MEGAPGRLPRTTFMDDPFFHHDPFDGFSRSPQPQRRFGSTPRLIDDDNDFFEDFRNQMPFGSLPRRHQSRSPRPPTNRGEPMERQERTIPVHRAPATTVPPPGPQQKKSPVPKAAVEINNAQSNYTNGELNPDRYQQPPAPDCPNPIIIKEVSLDSAKPTVEKRNSNSSNGSNKEEPIPLPAPATVLTQAKPPSPVLEKKEKTVKFEDDVQKSEKPVSNGVATKRQTFGETKKTSVDAGASEQLIHILDEAEKKVEQLREMASQLEQEKESLLQLISSVKVNAEILRLGQGDREDIDASSERILNRCKSVQVSVFTPRNEAQEKALEEVNKLIDGVTNKMKEDLNLARDTVERYLNACCPDDEPGPIDQRFQSRVIECTADDQKKIRRKLRQIIEQIDRANLVCNNPDY